MCLQGHAGQLCSFFYLVPSERKMCALTSMRQAITRAQNPLTRTEQGSTGQPLIRMTKLYCFHTNTQMHGKTKTQHLTRHEVAHIHEK